MRSVKQLFTIIAIFTAMAVMGSISAQNTQNAQNTTPPLTKKQQGLIIDSVCVLLDSLYVFPDVAQKMENTARDNFRKGKYKDLTDPDEFAKALSDDLFEICHDKHFWIRHIPGLEVNPDNAGGPTDEEIQRILERGRFTNFGFQKVDRMDGNVGYLKFNQFFDPKYGGDAAVATMNWLANCEALIIDLRDNGGGDAGMIRLISSYFFDEPTLLNNFYWRDRDTTEQSWTQSYVPGPKLTDVPLYILISDGTFSAAEEFTYNLKNLKRATIIGEQSAGGAHPITFEDIPSLDIRVKVPFGRAINPITGTNWEGTGVAPDIEASYDEALDVAYIEALKHLTDNAEDGIKKQIRMWIYEYKNALRNPFEISNDLINKYVGTYGQRKIFIEDGQLYYQREGRPKYKMIPMSEDTFVFDSLDYFRLKIETDAGGNPVATVGIYDNGQTDREERTGP